MVAEKPVRTRWDTKASKFRITRIRLQNWRNFTMADVALGRRVFVVGPNASGKSNFLDAIRFLGDVASIGVGLQVAVRRRGGVEGVRSLADHRLPDVSIEVSIGTDASKDAWSYRISFEQDRRRLVVVSQERVENNGKILLERPTEADRRDPELLTQTHLEQVQANAEFRPLVDFLRSIRYVHPIPQIVRDPDRAGSQEDDPYGGDFLDRIARASDKSDGALLRDLTRALRMAIPQLEELQTAFDERGIAHLRARFEHWSPEGVWQDEQQLSDGTIRLIGLIWSAFDGFGPLLFEEPETQLHPALVRYLPQLFYRAQVQTGRQIITSTQSSELLADEGIEPSDVLVLRPTRSGTKVSPAGDRPDIDALLRGGVSLGQLVIAQSEPADAYRLASFT